MIQCNDNSIIIDTHYKNNKRKKIFCVICFPKNELTLVNEEENRYRCDRCKNTYQLGFGSDIVPEEDELISSRDEDDEGPILVTADYTVKPEQVLDSHKPKSDIKIPWYMQNTDTTKVIDYQEN